MGINADTGHPYWTSLFRMIGAAGDGNKELAEKYKAEVVAWNSGKNPHEPASSGQPTSEGESRAVGKAARESAGRNIRQGRGNYSTILTSPLGQDSASQGARSLGGSGGLLGKIL